MIGQKDPLTDEKRKELTLDARIILLEVEMELQALAYHLQQRNATIIDLRQMKLRLGDCLSFMGWGDK